MVTNLGIYRKFAYNLKRDIIILDKFKDLYKLKNIYFKLR